MFSDRLKTDPALRDEWRAKISAGLRRAAEEKMAQAATILASMPADHPQPVPAPSWLATKTPEAKEKWRLSISANHQAAVRAARKAAHRRTDSESGGGFMWVEANEYARVHRITYSGAMGRAKTADWKRELRPGHVWILRVPTDHKWAMPVEPGAEPILSQQSQPAPQPVAAPPVHPPRRWWQFWRWFR